MATALIMPKQGQSVETCTLVSWRKSVGDKVTTGEIVCEVETDKATFEVESPADGTVLAIFHEAGALVPVLAPIAAIGTPGEDIEQIRRQALEGALAGVAGAAGATASTAPPPSATPRPAPAAAAAPAARPSPLAAPAVSPRARALAAARGLDLAGVAGSGPGGRVIERDVLAALAAREPLSPAAREKAAAMAAEGEAPAVPASGSGIGGRVMARDVTPSIARQPASGPGKVTEIPVKGVRKLIADRMLASLATTAQLTLNSSADARALQDLRRSFKESPEAWGLSGVTINDLVHFAVVRTLLAAPELNATFDGSVIRQHEDIHLAFATDTPRGLMVPVIRNAHLASLRELAAEAARLTKGCREGGVSPDELSGGTFTVTNLGALGIESFTPVLNVPQVAILGVCAIRLVAAPATAETGSAPGTVSFIPRIGLSLTINHQVVDGAPGARFLQSLGQAIASLPALLAR